MTAIRKRRPTPTDDDSVFENSQRLIARAVSAFEAAAQAQLAENDRRGIATHGAVDGRLELRTPGLAKPVSDH